MTDILESRVRSALSAMTRDVAADSRPDDVARRVGRFERRRARRRAGVAGVLFVATVGLLTAVLELRDHDSVPADSVPSDSVGAGACRAPAELPFTVDPAPEGWMINSRVQAGVGVVGWFGGGGVIEVWNGQRDVPTPGPGRKITVLGQQATIGAISDGYSVVFQLGPTRCEQWALVAHPAVGEQVLQQMAESLVLVD